MMISLAVYVAVCSGVVLVTLLNETCEEYLPYSPFVVRWLTASVALVWFVPLLIFLGFFIWFDTLAAKKSITKKLKKLGKMKEMARWN